MKKINTHAQETGSEIAMIKKLIGKIKFNIATCLVRRHEKVIGECRKTSSKYLMCKCDQEARRTREKINNRMITSKAKFHRGCSLKRKVVL